MEDLENHRVRYEDVPSVSELRAKLERLNFQSNSLEEALSQAEGMLPLADFFPSIRTRIESLATELEIQLEKIEAEIFETSSQISKSLAVNGMYPR